MASLSLKFVLIRVFLDLNEWESGADEKRLFKKECSCDIENALGGAALSSQQRGEEGGTGFFSATVSPSI